MKNRFLRWVLLTVLLCLAFSPALANSWGLKGDLLDVVMEDNRWNDYSALTQQQGDFAVMGGRYHNVLMRHKDGELLTYPLAVWQETDKMHIETPKLNLRNDGHVLEITYGDQESYAFQLNRKYDTYDSGDALIHAYVNGLNFTRTDYSLIVSDGSRDVVWMRDVRLENFNIKLFPQSIEEVLHLNRMYAILDSGRNHMDLGASSVNIGKGTAPVYSAPFTQSWRAAKGKASVGLSGQHWRMGEYQNADGEGFVRIRYEVSERTQRIGYVLASDLNTEVHDEHLFKTIRVPVETRTNTWLTDDPLVSQYQQFYLPASVQLICMGTYGDDYAWVSGKIKNGGFTYGGQLITDGDQIVWGYVPLKHLTISAEDEYRNTIEWDAMAQFAGYWHFAAGGVGVADYLTLYADGTWDGHTGDEQTGGTWRLTRYDPTNDLYWADVPYEITFIRDSGTVNIKGFWPDEDGNGFSLLYWEGSGGYERMMEPHSLPPETAGNG